LGSGESVGILGEIFPNSARRPNRQLPGLADPPNYGVGYTKTQIILARVERFKRQNAREFICRSATVLSAVNTRRNHRNHNEDYSGGREQFP
jgi:hypothetical protein